MNKRKVAAELIKVAESLIAIDFPTDEAMKKYLKEHLDADKSNHRVVKTEKTESAKAHKQAPSVIDKSKLPKGVKIEEHHWKATEEKETIFGKQPAQKAGVQTIIEVPEDSTNAQTDYLRSLGFTTWGSGGKRWLGEIRR